MNYIETPRGELLTFTLFAIVGIIAIVLTIFVLAMMTNSIIFYLLGS
mgnify:CR=1 FL=1